MLFITATLSVQLFSACSFNIFFAHKEKKYDFLATLVRGEVFPMGSCIYDNVFMNKKKANWLGKTMKLNYGSIFIHIFSNITRNIILSNLVKYFVMSFYNVLHHYLKSLYLVPLPQNQKKRKT